MGRSGDSVHVIGAIHVKSVEVNRGRLIAQIILQVDDDPVAHGGLDSRQWPLAIDANGGSVELSIRVGGHPACCKVVDPGRRRCERQQASEA